MATANDFIILIVDDDALDVEILCMALAKIDPKIQTARSVDGQHALELLNKPDSELANRRLVIFLDINMPRMNGMEFLAHIRTDSRYSGVPVLVFSTADQQRDISAANQFHVTGYITKLVGIEATRIAVSSLIDFLNVIEIPRYTPPARKTGATTQRRMRRLLIVDDDELDMQSVKRAATELGVMSHWVMTKDAALEELAGAQYDAVVTDFRLGLSDADELVAAMDQHAGYSALPVLVISGSRPPKSMMPNIIQHQFPVFSKDQVSTADFSSALARSMKLPEVDGTLS